MSDTEVRDIERELNEDKIEAEGLLRNEMHRAPNLVFFLVRVTNWMDRERVALKLMGKPEQAQGVEMILRKLRSFLSTLEEGRS